MITHIVLFKLIDNGSENVRKARDVLLTLKENIPNIRSIEVGIDILHSERSFDLALVIKFDSLEDLQAYQAHPVHIEVSDYMTHVRESTITVDFQSM